MFNIKSFFGVAFLAAFTMLSTVAFAGMFDQDKSDGANLQEQGAPMDQSKDFMEGKSQKDAIATWGQKDEPHFVEIDIKPDDDLNSVSTETDKMLEVAVLGSADFDVNNIDQGSLELGNSKGNGKFKVADRNNDGFDDLIAEFSTADLQLGEGTQELTLTGKTKDGKTFEGSDLVTISGSQ